MTDKLKDIKPGDRVRVTFEGVVTPSGTRHHKIKMDGSTINESWWATDGEINAPSFTIEKLSTPPVVGDRVTWGAGYTNDWRLVAIVDGRAIMWNGLKSLDRPIEEVRKEVEQ